jgi:hypothetical protein
MVEFRKMSDAEYFALSDVYHSSYTSRLLQSPAAFAAGGFQPSAAMDLGSYIHGLMADEVERFSRGPDLSGCTTADGKPTTSTSAKSVQAAIAAWQAANPNAIVLSESDFDKGQRCADNLKSEMAARGWKPTYREMAIVWHGNVPSVAKFDAIVILADRIIALDYKSHGKPLTNQGLSASAADFCYASQAAHYLDGIACAQNAGLLPHLPVEFWIGWTSTVQPFDSWFQRVGDEALVIGAADLTVAQDRWMIGKTRNRWPTAGELGLLDEVLTLPRWKVAAQEVF